VRADILERLPLGAGEEDAAGMEARRELRAVLDRMFKPQ